MKSRVLIFLCCNLAKSILGGFLRVGQPKGRILGYLCRYGSDVYMHVTFSYWDAHICMGYGKTDKEERGLLYAREMFIKMGKARLLYYFGTWQGLHTFPCFTADSDILIVQMRLLLSTRPPYSCSQIQAVPWDPLRIQQ